MSNLELEAGFVYAFAIFAVGFVIGTARTLLVAPRVGEVAAVSLEVPVMLAISWLACSWIVGRFEVPHESAARLGMGLTAFLILMSLELGLSVVAFHRSVAEHFASYGSLSNRIGLGAQIVFALLPFFAK